eukprot:CAMPEP_0117654510 /NCGR_PEP_ID=MMETSP0804-20121206/3782_1 /TAXON_ID=1074897 /ORGANISM="Tetraselmis astigmatica, Strain CCMP880" /LENGTH=47 /DNA_ID= /DNA_START= /DNA_END= /DNA_ORIENTATION=
MDHAQVTSLLPSPNSDTCVPCTTVPNPHRDSNALRLHPFKALLQLML